MADEDGSEEEEAERRMSPDGIGCRFPGSPAHSTVAFTVEGAGPGPGGANSPARLPTGSVATYSCERGFELLGPSRRVCSEDGRWTPDGIPFCVVNFSVAAYKRGRGGDEDRANGKALSGTAGGP
ncbi:hypothetical protein J437_LFUL016099 [Ladona fulva]|uniref:Sushi domain-containing protein n=1 Tax=Ladona fulva TaxID=123851 RepID=A0A8K0JZW4_LADFU|nr:hypothetical protein J437_LFUL016099 [Ladona fulva]